MIKVRKLTVDDLFKLAAIIGNLRKETVKEIVSAMDSKDTNAEEEIGISIFLDLLKNSEKDIKPFLASVCEMSPEEFGKQDYGVILEVIEQLIEKEDFGDFFKKAMSIVGKLSAKK